MSLLLNSSVMVYGIQAGSAGFGLFLLMTRFGELVLRKYVVMLHDLVPSSSLLDLRDDRACQVCAYRADSKYLLDQLIDCMDRVFLFWELKLVL